MKEKDMIASQMADMMTETATEFSIQYEKTENLVVKSVFKRLFFKKRKNTHGKKKERKFLVFPPSLAKMELFSKIIVQLDINEQAWKENPSNEVWRCCNKKTDLICRFIATAVTKDRKDLINEKYMRELTEFIKYNGTAEDFVKIFLIILQQIDLVNFTNAMLLTRLYKINEPKQ